MYNRLCRYKKSRNLFAVIRVTNGSPFIGIFRQDITAKPTQTTTVASITPASVPKNLFSQFKSGSLAISPSEQNTTLISFLAIRMTRKII